MGARVKFPRLPRVAPNGLSEAAPEAPDHATATALLPAPGSLAPRPLPLLSDSVNHSPLSHSLPCPTHTGHKRGSALPLQDRPVVVGGEGRRRGVVGEAEGEGDSTRALVGVEVLERRGEVALGRARVGVVVLQRGVGGVELLLGRVVPPPSPDRPPTGAPQLARRLQGVVELADRRVDGLRLPLDHGGHAGGLARGGRALRVLAPLHLHLQVLKRCDESALAVAEGRAEGRALEAREDLLELSRRESADVAVDDVLDHL